MKLTPKQESFAQAIADGMTQADAYRKSFNVSSTSKPQTIWDSASKVIANPHVSQRVAELKEKLEKKALWSREMSVKALVDAYQIAKKGQNPQAMTGAIKEINAMHGFNAPQKHEITGADGAPVAMDLTLTQFKQLREKLLSEF